MADARTRLQTHDLADLARAAFGRTLTRVDRLRGGSKKGVYRLNLDDGGTGIAYVWGAEENYWPGAPGGDPADPFTPADGIDLFVTAHRLLTDAGVRVPALILLDRDREMAALEDVRGGTLEQLATPDRPAVLDRFASTVRALHANHAGRYGRPGTWALPDQGLLDGGADRAEPDRNAYRALPDRVLDRALHHLAESAARVGELAAVAGRIEDELRGRHAVLVPRDRFTLIHGELGPDHVLVDPAGNPVIIDIEGVMYFDVEWEHVFLELRFQDDYRHLAAAGLDPDRLRFYRLAMYLSLVEGPLRLLDGDFPDRDLMRDIAEGNIRNALREIERPPTIR